MLNCSSSAAPGRAAPIGCPIFDARPGYQAGVAEPKFLFLQLNTQIYCELFKVAL